MEKLEQNTQTEGPWVIIPPTVLGDQRLSAGEKLVYGRVFGFIRKHGYCVASKEYLGKYIGLSKNTVRNYLSRLYELGYLHYEIIRDDRGEVVERRIYPTLVPNDVQGVVPNRVRPRTTPSTAGSTIEVKEKKESIENNVIEKSAKQTVERIEYYAKALANTLGDEKSISYYKQACRRHDAHRLIRKAREIVVDGGAKNPAAVFTAWLKNHQTVVKT